MGQKIFKSWAVRVIVGILLAAVFAGIWYLSLQRDVAETNFLAGAQIRTVKTRKGRVIEPGDIPVPVMEGHDFRGWFTDSQTTERHDFSQPAKRRTNLYAGFRERPADWYGGAGPQSR